MERIRKILISNAGFSLIELIVASAISLMLASVMVFVFVMAIETYTRLVRQYEAESEMVSAMFTIKSTFANSLNVVYGGPASVANNSATNRGGAAMDVTTSRIFSVNTTMFNTGAYMLAMGTRDMNVTANASNMFSYGMYYITPTATSSGALMIDLEKNTGGGWTRVSPVNAPHMYTRLIDIRFNNISILNANGSISAVNTGGANIGRPALGAEVRLSMRYYTKGREADFRWCPPGFLGSCSFPLLAKYYDISKQMKVVFANNVYNRNKYLAERPFGNLYLFKFAEGKER